MRKKWLSSVLAVCLLASCVVGTSACGEAPLDEGGSTPHTHVWKTSWSKNGEGHWFACEGCDERKDEGAHEENPCVICGYDQTHECSYGGYIYDADGHWEQCIDCEATTSKKQHGFSNGVCTICGYDQAQKPLDVCEVRDLEIIMAQAGQGAATLVKLPDGKDMLIDAGARSSLSEVQNLIYTYVEDFTIEYFVLTSTDEYVCSQASYMFADFDVLNFYRPNVRSDYAETIGVPEQYNQGESPYVESCEEYAAALDFSAYEECNVYTVDDTNCDFTYTFRDSRNKQYSYTIDFIVPVALEDRADKADNTVMISIEYQGVTTFITGYASNNNIDAYCNTYGDQKDVDVLFTYWRALRESEYAISRSDLRGTNFLEKINLTKGDYSILYYIATSFGISELISEVHDISTVYALYENPKIVIKVTAAGELTVTAE